MWMSDAAEQAGVNVQTIRYYERRGLLPPPPRGTSGYRDLPPDTVRRVRFIKRAQDLGFSLDEIAELLELRSDSVRNRRRVRGVAEQRLQQVERKIADLGAIRDVLRMLVHRCYMSRGRAWPIL